SALAKDRWTDHFIRLFALSGVAVPRFWLGILFQLWFAYYLGLFPIFGRIDASVPPPPRFTGLYLVDSLLSLDFAAFKSSLQHIILPALTLALSPIAQIMRLVRASMIEQTRKDYILMAQANGFPANLIVYKYMLKNAFTSTLTIIGLLYGFFLGGSFLVETVFTWPGMARYGIRGLIHKDFNAVVGVTLAVGIGYSLVNFLVDICYGYLDPRIRYGEER
ncbi:MAG: ABC transporter permease, partial [Nitrospinota bacterium]